MEHVRSVEPEMTETADNRREIPEVPGYSLLLWATGLTALFFSCQINPELNKHHYQ